MSFPVENLLNCSVPAGQGDDGTRHDLCRTRMRRLSVIAQQPFPMGLVTPTRHFLISQCCECTIECTICSSTSPQVHLLRMMKQPPIGGLALPELPASSCIAKNSWSNSAFLSKFRPKWLETQLVRRFNPDKLLSTPALRLFFSTQYAFEACLPPQKALN